MYNLEEVFASFNHQKALIIGDVMIDSYIWGEVQRISPEAPVPIVNTKKTEKRLGGAANVAVNLQALGAVPILCAVVGQDIEGQDLLGLLQNLQMPTDGIVQSQDRITTIKHRILAGHQHLLRVDSEMTHLLAMQEKETLWNKIELLLPHTQVVIFEDYDKGVLDKELIQRTVALAKQHQIPTIVDPKLRNFWHYEGVTVFKPNLKELKEGLKIDLKPNNIPVLKDAIKILKERLKLEQALVTLSEFGVYIDAQESQHHIAAYFRSIADVSGAGDTVVSVAALALASKLSPKLMAGLANLAGGLVCEQLGVVPITHERLYLEAQKYWHELV